MDRSKDAKRLIQAQLHLEVQLLYPQELLQYLFLVCIWSCSSHTAEAWLI